MPIQLNIWLLLFGGLQGLLLSAVLVKKKTYRQGYGFLLAYLLVMLAQILFKVLDKHWLMEGSKTLYFLSYKLPFLYGPLAWFFVRRLLQGQKFKTIHLLHFLPFAYSVVVLNLSRHGVASDLLFWPMLEGPALLLQVVSLLCYHLLALRIWRQHQRQLQASFSDLHRFQSQWLKTFLIASLAVGIAIALFAYFIYVSYPAHNWLRYGFLLLGLFIYHISYSALQQPKLFSAFANAKAVQAQKPPPLLPALVVHRPQKKYAHSTLSDEEANRILADLQRCMQQERLYAEPMLTIDDLLARVHTSRHLLSQVLNERLGQSFYQYINSWRVEAAKELLADAKFDQLKIAAIGYEAGFNSLSTFNDVFKKMAGLTPSAYKKKAAQNGQQQRV